MSSKTIKVRLVADKRFDPGGDRTLNLGPWCVEAQALGGSHKNLIPHPLQYSNVDYLNFCNTVESLYLLYLEAFVLILNGYNKTAFDKRHWEIIIGTFLYRYIQVNYERYVVIQNLIDKHEDFSTIVLDESSFREGGYSRPLDFYKEIQSDYFNLETFTKIFSASGFKFPSKTKVAGSNREHCEKPLKPNIGMKIVTFLINLVAHFKSHSKIIFVKNSYFGNAELIKFVVKSNFKVFTSFGSQEAFVEKSLYDPFSRSEMLKFLPSENEFQKFLNPILSNDFPICYFEGLEATMAQAKDFFPKINPDLIFSANSWHYDDLFKIWVAKFCDTAQYVGMQHGGNYGVADFIFEEFLEKRITNTFWTWGWSEKDSGAMYVKCATKISDYKGVQGAREGGILFSSTVKPRFFGDTKRAPWERLEYFKCHKIFLKNASCEVLNAVRFRPYDSDQNPELEDLWTKHIGNECLERWEVKFTDSLKKCEIYVCDHIMTTYIEALKLNVPTLILLDDRFPSGKLRESAVEHFKLLEKVGIVHPTMESLVSKLNKVYPSVEKWWNTSSVQSAKNDFVYQYARSSSASIQDIDSAFSILLGE